MNLARSVSMTALLCAATACPSRRVEERVPTEDASLRRPAAIPIPAPAVDAPASPAPVAQAPELDAPPDSSIVNQRIAAEGIDRLAADLFGRLRGEPGNLAISPASIALAFGMTETGARAETLAQMRSVLHTRLDPELQSYALGALSWRWNHSLGDGVTARSANRLFGQRSYVFDSGFLSRTRDQFGAPLEPVDFAQNAVTRQRINDWVAAQTSDKIRDLLPETAINAGTRLVLVNAMYLRAAWESPFLTEVTRDGGFYVGSVAAQVPMMGQSGRYPYAQASGFRVLELPYRGGELVMDLVLPDARDGIGAVEAGLTSDRLRAALRSLRPTSAVVRLPRFRVATASFSLRDALTALGMPLAFDPARADFSGIASPPSPSDRLFITDAFHKVFVDVSEAGTEAAAATAVAQGFGGGGLPPASAVRFEVDHPFVFVIRDRTTDAVLFLGRVLDPRL